MVTVEELRLALRLSNGALDSEILDTRDAALLDLRAAGVDPGEGDALVRQAVKLYARTKFIQKLFRNFALYPDEISLLNFVFGVRKAKRELPVVREKEHAFAVVI